MSQCILARCLTRSRLLAAGGSAAGRTSRIFHVFAGVGMAVSVESFLKYLSESGILAPQDFQILAQKVPAEIRQQDAQEFARGLARQKVLTLFQVNALYNGKPRGLTLGNYVLLEQIGTGGMGMVFRAQHRRMKRIVAVKVLPKNMTKDPDTVKRFHREVQAAAKLTHPNIVAAYDADESNGVHFLAMEYVEGVDLARHVKEKGPMSVDKALDCILQAARGLEHAHARGIIHRDIKPGNLLLDVNGTVKVLDMGLALIHENPADGRSNGDAAPLTETRAIIGTVDFMSPEQAVDSRQADHVSDIYSLGMTLHFLLIGKATYDGDTAIARMLAHREAPVPSLCAQRPEVPAQVEAIFQRMAAKSKGDRYASVTDLIRDLSNWREVTAAPGTGGPAASIPQNVISAIFDDE